MGMSSGQQRILGITPFAEPEATLAVAIARAGAHAVLDLGSDAARARAALAEATSWWTGPLGVRVGPACALAADELPASITTVVLAAGAPWTATQAAGAARTVIAEVGSVPAARAAVSAGITQLLARGSESGGPAGEASSFVLLQQLLGADLGDVEIWLAGGIGPHTAAAAIAGGATGVVLDSQLALVRELDLPCEVAAAVRAMDGTETALIGGHRVYVRPDLTRADAAGIAQTIGGRSLAALPVGEDGALARPLAERHVTAGGIIGAVATSIENSIRSAAAAPTTPRIVQGPMTRVSDQAAFALAVARDGGLPFLALALMSGEDTRALLTETAELMGELPWGVGILGFVPDEVRDAQLEAVHEVRPQYALIAGGRPAQAAPLEAAGITTFLHVPSPTLLDRFLAEGARRFVFEGSECGGHVGPRASFPLWDLQIQHLLAYGTKNNCLAELDILFAGGIHDARSAAMVAAAAAPITAAGGAAGFLMGTAYLFTTEAVTAGAIGPAFQRAALACDSTVLLETAPGHATRCAPTAFVDTFAETRDRMFAEGTPREQVWAELEKLNIGRLRIASKGIRREGSALIPVDENTQARDGMVMIGDVARLRSAVTTIAELHAQVTSGAQAFLSARADELGLGPIAAEHTDGLQIAVVGMAAVFPQADSLAEFWAHTLADHDAIVEVPSDRWDASIYFEGDGATLNGRSGSTSKWGGFLGDIPFDALAYGIPPAALASIEPVQLLSLEVAARALRDAGYATREFDRERTGVIFGAEPGTDLSAAYGFRALYPQLHGEMPAELDAQLPTLTEDSFPGVLANVISGRIANRLDLGGANYTVDAACASALAALEVACMQLRAGAADMVLAGGADIHNGIQDYLLFASVGALSKSGHCKPFDARADGITLGEGVATVVLKRLADAERDGDTIYAVISGIGSSSDGKSLGLTAPRPEGQRRALERAYAMAGVSPADVGLVEAHGTGTVVGDRTELTVLTEVFTEHGATVGSCALGSVKSQIGHTKCTAGLAGLIKASLAIYNGVLPPTGKITAPNPAWVAGQSPFVFDATARPWPTDRPRVAGVSAFGFGGTNFHTVLTGYAHAPAPKHGLDQWPAELFVVRGSSRADAVVELDRLAELCATNETAGRPWRLRDLARTFDECSAGTVQLSFVAADLDDLVAKIAVAREFRAGPAVFVADPEVATGELAFLFPGQGSQRPGMLADLFTSFPRLGSLLALGERWVPTMFPPAAFDAETKAAQRAALTDTRVAQPALGIADLAMFTTLSGFGVTPDHLAGHSYGELVALTAAGALTPADLLEISAARGEAILAAAGSDPGTMAAVSAGATEVRAALNGSSGVVIANINSPEQTVISGPTVAIDDAVLALAARGLSAQRIPVACAFHSPVVADASRTLEAELRTRAVGSPHLPVWANATAAPYPLGASAVREMLADQVASPVRFAEQIEAMYAAGARVFVECGPGRVLTGLVGAILGDRPHTAIGTDAPGRHGVHSLLTALGRLAAAGVDVDTAPLFAGRDARLVSAGDVPRRPGWVVNGHLVRTAEGIPVANGLRPAARVELSTAPAAQPAPAVVAAPVASDAREAIVLEFLRSGREMIAAQRDVVLGFLGSAPAAPTAPVAIAVPVAQPVAAPVVAAPVVAAPVVAVPVVGDPVVPAAPAPAALTPEHVLGTLTTLISERTGYPADMLGADLDLEADLSIASLKRTEILGLLADRLPAAGLDEAFQAQLSRIRTLRGMVEAITSRAPEATPAHPIPAQIAPAHTVVPVEAPSLATPAHATPAHASVVLTAAHVLGTVTALIAERTGYPVDMLGADLDLEADLSIGSLKRTEILGLLADRMPDAGLDEAFQAKLSRIRTLRGMVDAIIGQVEAPAAPAPVAVAPVIEDLPAREAVRRYLVELTAADPISADGNLMGRHVTVVAGGLGIAIELTEALEERGATVRIVSTDPGTELGDVDILIHLGAAGPSEPPSLPDAFQVLRRAVLGGARQLLVVTGTGGRLGHRVAGDAPTRSDAPAGIGLAGLVRTIAREYPHVACRALDIDPKDTPDALTARLLAEVLNPAGPEVIGYADGVRATLALVPATLASDALPSAAELNLTAGSVVLLTGGARGITARAAAGFAEVSGCHIELWGRSPLPPQIEDASTASAVDENDLRRAFIAAGVSVPAQIEREVRRVLAEREIRTSMAALAAVAASVTYTAVDVRDASAVQDGIAEVMARHGHIDGVVHGAGVLDDRLIADKSSDGFARVWETKVDGARALAAALPGDLGFLVMFGSVSGVFGNRGQCDYAAANDALDCLARSWETRFAGRVVSVDWGPWLPTTDEAGNGMVSAELLRTYARQGVGAIHPEDGVAALLRELAHGTTPQVVYVCADPAAFDVAFSSGNVAG